MQQRERIERAINRYVAPELLQDTIDAIMDILEDECQTYFDEGYSEGYRIKESEGK